MKKYEAVFHRYHFLHLTGVKINQTEISSAIHFYEKCLGHRLTESDFRFAGDGSTNQKLEILENMDTPPEKVLHDFTEFGYH